MDGLGISSGQASWRSLIDGMARVRWDGPSEKTLFGLWLFQKAFRIRFQEYGGLCAGIPPPCIPCIPREVRIVNVFNEMAFCRSMWGDPQMADTYLASLTGPPVNLYCIVVHWYSRVVRARVLLSSYSSFDNLNGRFLLRTMEKLTMLLRFFFMYRGELPVAQSGSRRILKRTTCDFLVIRSRCGKFIPLISWLYVPVVGNSAH